LCFIKVKLSVKFQLFVSLLCVCAILPEKAIFKMTYIVLGGTLNLTHLHNQYEALVFMGSELVDVQCFLYNWSPDLWWS